MNAMLDLVYRLEFWVAMGFAVVVKVSSSPSINPWRAFFSILIAITSALVGTWPLIDWLQLDPEIYAPFIAALVALTSEHLSRQVLNTSLTDILAAWRGKK